MVIRRGAAPNLEVYIARHYDNPDITRETGRQKQNGQLSSGISRFDGTLGLLQL